MNIQEAIFPVIDTETTGLNPETGDAIVEIAVVVTSATEELSAVSSLVNPCRPIPPEASAVHHIVDEDVQNAPTLPVVLGHIMQRVWGEHPHLAAFVAHNAPFDSAFLPGFIDAPWLDTHRLAKRLFPAFEQHTNEYLRYKLGITYPGIREENPHRAQHDARVTAALLRRFIHEIVTNRADFPQDVRELIDFIARPMILAGPVQFGKHKGKLWPQVAVVDRGYLAWISKQPDMDVDTLCTARHYLGYR